MSTTSSESSESLLSTILSPADLKPLSTKQLNELAYEIREFLVEKVSASGGHLGSNLGVVELTLALHRVFDSPRDRILWDTGHQTYVHKILTGRQAGFDTLRQKGGLSGYSSRAESDHDFIENSHASTVLSYADGLAKAYQLRHIQESHIVAVIGDGALTGGMAWEALNNIAAAKSRQIIIVVNDNGRSYAPTSGGLATHLTALRTSRAYEHALDWINNGTGRLPVVGGPLSRGLRQVKKSIKNMVAPQRLFEDLGIKYIGPVDGHDLAALQLALTAAKKYHGPVIVHCMTKKGRGYAPAERNDIDRAHAIAACNPATGKPLKEHVDTTWTEIFGDEILALGAERSDIVAVTAAMLEPVGLGQFARAYPDRIFDVGIAEQQAVTSAAGLALGGMHPVVAMYATFLNRAFDQLLMDVALHNCGVTIVLDRAGVTGPDGASHNGVWDLSMLQIIPNLRLAAPRDAHQLALQLREAVNINDAPTVIRFPKGSVNPHIPAIKHIHGIDILCGSKSTYDVLIIAIGAMAATCLAAAELLGKEGVGVSVVDPRWVKPVNPHLGKLAQAYRLVVTVEDNIKESGAGAATANFLAQNGLVVPIRNLGLPQRFFEHASRAQILDAAGLTPIAIATYIQTALNETR